MDRIDRIVTAIEYIESNLDRAISLCSVAEEANSSLYWFHRIFPPLAGDSLGGYVRKRRLNAAAFDLVTTDARILDIAIKYGYSGHEAFTRAFHAHFRILPSAYRKAGIFAPRKLPESRSSIARRNRMKEIRTQERRNAVGARIVELPACRAYTSAGKDLEAFDAWWSGIDGLRKPRFFPRDFMYYDGESESLVWLYVLEGTPGPAPFELVDFAGGLYAVGTAEDGNDLDGERAVAGIKEWIGAEGCFGIDESKERPVLFHIVTPESAFDKMGYRQLDIFVPIR